MAHCNLTICLPFAQAQILLLKLASAHYNALYNKITNWNVLKKFSLICEMRIRMIAMRTSGYVQRNP